MGSPEPRLTGSISLGCCQHSRGPDIFATAIYRSSSLTYPPPKSKSSTWRGHLVTVLGSIGLIAFAALIFAAIGWTKFQQAQDAMSAPPPPETPVAVRLFQPQRSEYRGASVVVGSAKAHQWVMVRNEETGVVTDVSMTPGGTVHAGELLVQIDDRIEQAQLKAATATLNQALALLERAKKLNRAKANSEEALDIAVANAQRAQAQVDQLNVLIDRKRITAEFDARVGLFDLHVGQYLVAGSDIATLEGIADHLHIDFAVPAHVADQIHVGENVLVRANESSAAESARIIALDSRADPQSRSLTVRARLESPPETLLPGDSVLVTVSYGQPIEAVLVPQTAVRRSPSGTTVFRAVEVPSDDGSPPSLRAKSTTVQLVGSDGTMSRIIAGLTLEDQVISDGSFKVLDGSLLIPIPFDGEGATDGNVLAEDDGGPGNGGIQ